MEITIASIIAFSGWILALIQFVLTHVENRKKNQSELLEKTLGYFERGTQARSIGISLVQSIWLKRKKKMRIVIPVLVSQVVFLFRSAEDFGQEKQNLIRILTLLYTCSDKGLMESCDKIEILEALTAANIRSKGISLGKESLKQWYANFNDGSTVTFESGIDLS